MANYLKLLNADLWVLGHNHTILILMHFQYPEEMRNFMYDPTSVIRGLHYDIRKGRIEHKLFANLGFSLQNITWGDCLEGFNLYFQDF